MNNCTGSICFTFRGFVQRGELDARNGIQFFRRRGKGQNGSSRRKVERYQSNSAAL